MKTYNILQTYKKILPVFLFLLLCMLPVVCLGESSSDTYLTSSEQGYQNAISLMESGEYRQALNQFIILGDYSDSELLAEKCYNNIIVAPVQYSSDGKEYLIDKDGEVICGPLDWIANIIEDGLIRASTVYELPGPAMYHIYNRYSGYNMGYITKLGEWVHPQISGSPYITHPYDGFIAVLDQESGLWGYKKKPYGHYIINPQFIDAYSFSEGRGAVCVKVDNENKRWGFIDSNGAFIVDPVYESVISYSEGVARVGNRYVSPVNPTIMNMKWGFIDLNGTVIVEPKYNFIGGFSEGGAWFSSPIGLYDVGYGWVDTAGNILIEPNVKFRQPTCFINGVSWAYIDPDNGLGIIDKNGKYKICVPDIYTGARNMNIDVPFDSDYWTTTAIDTDGVLFRGTEDSVLGYLNLKGELVIRDEFSNIGTFMK